MNEKVVNYADIDEWIERKYGDDDEPIPEWMDIGLGKDAIDETIKNAFNGSRWTLTDWKNGKAYSAKLFPDVSDLAQHMERRYRMDMIGLEMEIGFLQDEIKKLKNYLGITESSKEGMSIVINRYIEILNIHGIKFVETAENSKPVSESVLKMGEVETSANNRKTSPNFVGLYENKNDHDKKVVGIGEYWNETSVKYAENKVNSYNLPVRKRVVENPDEIREYYQNTRGATIRSVAKRFGISYGTVYNVINRKSTYANG